MVAGSSRTTGDEDECTTASAVQERMEKTVRFSGHGNQISSIVRLCQEGGLFTDAELICEDGTIHVHRIVLGAVSEFLHCLLKEVWSQERASLLLPGIRSEVASQLVEFIYTGYMQLCEYNSWELQQLVLQLQIDPQNVVVDVVNADNVTKPSVKTKESVSIRSKPKTESQPPRSQDPHRRPATKQQHQPHQDHHHTRLHRQPSPAITNNSRKSSPPSRRKSSLSSTGDEDRKATVVVQPAKERKPLQQLAAALAEEDRRSVERRSNRRRSSDSFRSYSECSPPESPERLTGVSPRRGSPRRGTSPRGGAARNRSISGRGARDQSPGKRSRTSSGRGTGDPTVSSTGEFMSVLRPSETSNVIKIVSSRKRRRSSNDAADRYSNQAAKDAKTEGGGGGGGSGRGRGKAGVMRARGRVRSRGVSSSPRVGKEKGRHDMRNVETWVCAICGQYDPVLPGDGGGDTTEWIGCDCNRWFHKFCTKLSVVDDSFSCRMVQKTCLIHALQ